MSVPVFETKNLILREPELSDVPSWTKNFVDYEVIRHLSSRVPWPYPENGIQDFLLNIIQPNQGRALWSWAILAKGDLSELIGVIELYRKDALGNRGFWLARKHWGKGFMTEAVKPVNDYAFNELGFEKLEFGNALGNTASRKIKEKTGARFLGTQPGQFVDPAYTQREVWELTREAWFSSQK